MDENQTNLIAAQLKATITALRRETERLETDSRHQLSLINQRLDQLEKCVNDHEQRIRSATEGVTQFKVWSGLSSGGASIMAIVAMVKAFLGG